jgi:DNA invertase Pin-like site-specific DNA recombinase
MNTASKKVYLYGRVDGQPRSTEEPQGIAKQRAFLAAYADEEDFKDCEFIYDAGFSDENIDWPAFSKLIDEVEAGLVGVVIVMDLSRLGGDYQLADYYLNVLLPSKKVRFIAVGNAIDSAMEDNDSAGMLRMYSLYVKLMHQT